jgi:hypothetical protein
MSTSDSSSPEAAFLLLHSRFEMSTGKVSVDYGTASQPQVFPRADSRRLHSGTSSEFWLNFNLVSIWVSGIIDEQNGKYGGHCSPHRVLCKPTTCQSHEDVMHNFTRFQPTRTNTSAQVSEQRGAIANLNDSPAITKGKMVDDIVLQLSVDC